MRNVVYTNICGLVYAHTYVYLSRLINRKQEKSIQVVLCKMSTNQKDRLHLNLCSELVHIVYLFPLGGAGRLQ